MALPRPQPLNILLSLAAVLAEMEAGLVSVAQAVAVAADMLPEAVLL